ncbi:hypothetical protein IFM89_033115, partial [Coptis chinensis]
PRALYKYKRLFKLFHLHNGENGNGNKFYKIVFAADELKRDILHELPLIFSTGLKLGSPVFIVSKLCAVDNSGTVIGIKYKDGIVMGVEKLIASKMMLRGSNRRIHSVHRHSSMGLSVWCKLLCGLIMSLNDNEEEEEEEGVYHHMTGGGVVNRNRWRITEIFCVSTM